MDESFLTRINLIFFVNVNFCRAILYIKIRDAFSTGAPAESIVHHERRVSAVDEAEETARLFKRLDFSAERRGLAERLWGRTEHGIRASEGDYELTEGMDDKEIEGKALLVNGLFGAVDVAEESEKVAGDRGGGAFPLRGGPLLAAHRGGAGNAADHREPEGNVRHCPRCRDFSQ